MNLSVKVLSRNYLLKKKRPLFLLFLGRIGRKPGLVEIAHKVVLGTILFDRIEFTFDKES